MRITHFKRRNPQTLCGSDTDTYVTTHLLLRMLQTWTDMCSWNHSSVSHQKILNNLSTKRWEFMSKKWRIFQKVNSLQTGGSSCQVTSSHRRVGRKCRWPSEGEYARSSKQNPTLSFLQTKGEREQMKNLNLGLEHLIPPIYLPICTSPSLYVAREENVEFPKKGTDPHSTLKKKKKSSSPKCINKIKYEDRKVTQVIWPVRSVMNSSRLLTKLRSLSLLSSHHESVIHSTKQQNDIANSSLFC